MDFIFLQHTVKMHPGNFNKMKIESTQAPLWLRVAFLQCCKLSLFEPKICSFVNFTTGKILNVSYSETHYFCKGNKCIFKELYFQA